VRVLKAEGAVFVDELPVFCHLESTKVHEGARSF
jgi:hypothetical protein